MGHGGDHLLHLHLTACDHVVYHGGTSIWGEQSRGIPTEEIPWDSHGGNPVGFP